MRRSSSARSKKSNGSTQRVVIALYSYEARDENELSFEKGDKMVIIDDKEPDWWLAERKTSGQRGLIPMNFVVNNIIETEEWDLFSWLSLSLHLGLSDGSSAKYREEKPRSYYWWTTTLVEHSSSEIVNKDQVWLVGCEQLAHWFTCQGAFSLSIRDFDSIKFDHVKHYKIREKPDGYYYITSRRSFPRLQDLVLHYSQSSNGLCCRLVKPCPKSVQLINPNCPQEIDRCDLETIRELGSGNFGKVYHGKFKGHIDVAIKTLKPGTMSPKQFLMEAAIMRKYRHNKLVALYGVVSVDHPLLIITEYMCNGSLLDYLRKSDTPEGDSLTVIDLIDIAAQVASAMAYLESMKVVHRDLAARNVLVSDH